jgi:hypothetical protein
MGREYPFGSDQDRKMLTEMSEDRLLDYFFVQIRNLWRVDGLYFLGIEKRFGTQAATEVDAWVWETMAELEARNLQKMFNVPQNANPATIVDLLRRSSWAMDQPFKTTEVSSGRAILEIKQCRTQETRLNKGLGEFPCKQVRFGYLKKFATTLNPHIRVNCIVCPPDKHPKDSWCKWEFVL